MKKSLILLSAVLLLLPTAALAKGGHGGHGVDVVCHTYLLIFLQRRRPDGPGVAARAEAGIYLPSRRARVKTPGAAAGCAAADSGHEGVGTDETVAS